MTPLQRQSAGLMLCASALALLAVQTARADSWLAFGDSLTDTGNAFALTGDAVPDPRFYDNGRFSNGPLWFDRIAGEHGLMADHLLGTSDPTQHSWNFAVAGATSGTEALDPATATPPGLRAQVDMAQALIGAGAVQAGADTTAVLWAGANDHGLWLTAPGRDAALDGLVADAVAANIDAATRGIAEAGVGRVAVLNLFDFSLAPTTALLPPEVQAAGDAMVARHNAALLRQAEAADVDTGAQVLLVDVHALFDAIASDPAAWGFDTLAPCLPDGGAPDCTAPGSAERRVFWDGTHLTATAQGLVAGMVQGTLAAAHDLPRLSGETTALAATIADRHIDDVRRQARYGARGGWVEATRVTLTAGRQSGQVSGLAGGWSDSAGGLSWGASLGWGSGETGGGAIDAEAWTAAAYLRQEIGWLGLTAQVGLGHAGMDVMRDTGFGPAPRATGRAEADTRMIDLGADLRIAAGGATLLLDGGLTWAETRRDSYAEAGGGLMNGRIDGQRLETLSVRLGATAAMELDAGPLPLRAFARVAWEDVLLSDLAGGGVTLASGQRIEGSGVSGIVEGTEIELGLSGRVGDNLTARASWSLSPFDDALSDGRAAVSLGLRF
ncbi:SGNH/GDSL hydrolase family protein [Roseicyclus persicicus]|uniref:Autotransporter domain-containing protein n=1 Tax=Roseicyclus persicicus TaxID=2650661 RepID=A0A7X6GZK6_9RHOB|nr:SGNH/GDSL hydrolase family protein [Roseibacterium persicicum]NKX44644.1 autotransporter domain-containing protein [Roseibacterium persicicum]